MKQLNICLLMLASILIHGCEKKDGEEAAAVPVIKTVWPQEGAPSTIVTIRGKHFSPVRTENTVQFNGIAAIVIEASAGELQVVSPASGSTGPITLSVRNTDITGPVFTYTKAPEEYTVKIFAGNGTAGSVDGSLADIRLRSPEGVVMDAAGNLVITDRGNNRIRRITPGGIMTTVAGADAAGYADGDAGNARFRLPWRSAVDAAGNIIVADRDNHCIRRIAPDGTVSTIAGTGTAGFADGDNHAARFNQPLDVAVDAAGNIYVADNLNHRIRRIAPDGTVSTLAGNGTAAFADGNGTEASLRNPSGIDIDAEGNVLVADRLNHRIRRITPQGVVTTIAGEGTKGFSDGEALLSRFADPYGITTDSKGNIIIADLNNAKIRKIDKDMRVSTIAGTSQGLADGAGITARFSSPVDVCVDAADNIYVADLGNHCIRKISPVK